MTAQTLARRRTRLPRTGFPLTSGEHVVTVAVALATVAACLPDGAYSTQARAVLCVAVWWVALGGLALRLLPRAPIPTPAVVSGACLVGLAAFTALSIGWASDYGGAFDEAMRAAGYAGVFVLVVVASPAGSARAWLAGLATGLVAVAALALGSRLFPAVFSEQELASALPETRGRLSYPLGYWNGLGATLVLGLVLLVAFGGLARSTLGRAAATACIPVAALAVFLTASRGAAVAGAAGLVLLFLLTERRVRLAVSVVIGGAAAAGLIAAATARDVFADGHTKAAGYTAEANDMLLLTLVAVAAALTLRALADGLAERIRVPRAISVAVAALTVVVLVVGLLGADPARRWDELKAPPDVEAGVDARGIVTRHLTSTEGTGRYQFWEAGWKAFESEPLIGIGAAGYETWWSQHGSIDYYVRNAHSLVVETAAELGLVGLALLVGFIAAAAVGGVRGRLAGGDGAPVAAAGLALLAAGVTGAALEWTWEIPGAFIPVVVAAALLAGPALGAGRPRPARTQRLLAVGVAVAGVAAVVAGGIALTTDAQLRLSRDAARDGDLQAASVEARRAAAIQPWAAAPRLQLALVYEEADPAAALRRAEEAVDRAGEDWRAWLVLTRLRAATGDRPRALVALRRTRELAPRLPGVRNLLGVRQEQP